MDKVAVVAALLEAAETLEDNYSVSPAPILRTLAERIEGGHEDDDEWIYPDRVRQLPVLIIDWSPDKGSE